MFNLTEKGKAALAIIKQNFPSAPFTYQDVKAASGQSIAAATLTALVNKELLIKEDKTYSLNHEILTYYEAENAAKGCDNTNLNRAKAVKTMNSIPNFLISKTNSNIIAPTSKTRESYLTVMMAYKVNSSASSLCNSILFT